jgi:acyl-coenzyme A synthetase/AMP-(fatty) acid ligase
VEIRDLSGKPLGPEEPGALYVRGASIALGYWHRTDASRTVFQGEWLSTGDTYVRGTDGYFRCLGRNSDMLKAGGIWVSPGEVESRLLEHPAVREAAVIGVPDGDGLDKPVAVVVVAPGVTPEELVGWCREHLAHYKCPSSVDFLDALPRNPTGKILKRDLRRPYWEGRDRSIV